MQLKMHEKSFLIPIDNEDRNNIVMGYLNEQLGNDNKRLEKYMGKMEKKQEIITVQG